MHLNQCLCQPHLAQSFCYRIAGASVWCSHNSWSWCNMGRIGATHTPYLYPLNWLWSFTTSNSTCQAEGNTYVSHLYDLLTYQLLICSKSTLFVPAALTLIQMSLHYHFPPVRCTWVEAKSVIENHILEQAIWGVSHHI